HQSGPLQWWKYRVPSLCKSVVQWSPEKGAIAPNSSPQTAARVALGGKHPDETDSNLGDYGISLGSANVGFAMGVIQMPRNQLWQVSVTITTRHADGSDGPTTAPAAPDDGVVIKFGSALDSLQ